MAKTNLSGAKYVEHGHGMMILMFICDDMSVRSRMIRRRRVVKNNREN